MMPELSKSDLTWVKFLEFFSESHLLPHSSLEPTNRRYNCSKRELFDLSQIPQAMLVRYLSHERETFD